MRMYANPFIQPCIQEFHWTSVNIKIIRMRLLPLKWLPFTPTASGAQKHEEIKCCPEAHTRNYCLKMSPGVQNPFQICRNLSRYSLGCWVYRIHRMKVPLISDLPTTCLIKACLYFVEKVSEFWFMSLRFVGADITTGQGFIFAEAAAVLKPSVALMHESEFPRQWFQNHLLKWNIIAARALLAGNMQVKICLLWLSKCKPSCCPENHHLTAWEEIWVSSHSDLACISLMNILIVLFYIFFWYYVCAFCENVYFPLRKTRRFFLRLSHVLCHLFFKVHSFNPFR